MKNMWGMLAVGALTAGLLTGCGGSNESSCEAMVSTGVSRGASMEDVDRALRACADLEEFEAATVKHPGLIDAEPAVFVANRCKYNPELADYPICK